MTQISKFQIFILINNNLFLNFASKVVKHHNTTLEETYLPLEQGSEYYC